ncbi:hypothetical protein ACWD2L_09935 [Streptomyces sp. NPDC002754]
MNAAVKVRLSDRSGLSDLSGLRAFCGFGDGDALIAALSLDNVVDVMPDDLCLGGGDSSMDEGAGPVGVGGNGGHALRATVEQHTDQPAAEPWRMLGAADTERLYGTEQGPHQ